MLTSARWSSIRGHAWQIIAVLACFLFGLCLIVNVQLGGEAMWFWYATLFHRGRLLYADLQLVLQPFYVLETNAWMRIAGSRCIPYELLAVLHLAGLCCAILLVLRESRWPDWQKAILFLATFSTIVHFTAYRFDDFHVLADIFYLVGIALLFWVARASSRSTVYTLAAALGVLNGVAITTRLTDGGLLAAAVVCALPLALAVERVRATVVCLCVTGLSWALVVLATGDTFRTYWTLSVVRAGSAKGGTSSVLRGPLASLADSGRRILIGSKREIAVLILVLSIGFLVSRFWKKNTALVLAAEVLAILVIARIPQIPGELGRQLQGTFTETLSTLIQPIAYLLVIVVLVRAGLSFVKGTPWDRREAVVFIPAATLLSAAVSQANSTSNSTITLAVLCLLVPCLLMPNADQWKRGSFLALLLVAGISGLRSKVLNPYDWGSAKTHPMFTGREWYHHPLYGPMYLDSTVLKFNQGVCQEIGATGSSADSGIELFSIPFPYANYFCGVTPWRDHVQLWYDTVTPSTVATVMDQLAAQPPRWILYQRYPFMIEAHEKEYNHEQPIPHHYLDLMFAHRIVEGQWDVAKKSQFIPREAWYLIRTKP